MKTNAPKSEFLTTSDINSNIQTAASSFVVQAKKIARSMATNYNVKKKAYESASVSFSQTGSLDISRIHSYRTSDDIFKRNVMLKEGSSHGLVCALDFSASMDDILNEVAMQFLITSLFSKYIGIQFRFFTFTSSRTGRDSISSKNPFTVDDSSSYARFVDIGNQDMSEGQLIESFYHILSLSAIENTSRDIFTDKYRKYIRTVFGSMSSTPLLAAVYQSYLIAKQMQNNGIQNVNILAINDGDNNCHFVNPKNGSSNYITSIEDPYTKRIYQVNPENVGRNGGISAINKMIRENGIKIYNMFLHNRLSANIDICKSCTSTYMRDMDVPENFIPEDKLNIMFQHIIKHGKYEINNLCYYDSVIFVDTKIFPKIHNYNQESDVKVTDDSYLAERKGKLKKLSSLGTFLSDSMVSDFKLSNLKN